MFKEVDIPTYFILNEICIVILKKPQLYFSFMSRAERQDVRAIAWGASPERSASPEKGLYLLIPGCF